LSVACEGADHLGSWKRFLARTADNEKKRRSNSREIKKSKLT